jgi:flagellar hook-associated protein 1 FlgK
MNAALLGVSTTEHNIANASTPGFTRQEVVLGARAAQASGAGFVGQGVDVAGVKRIYDQFLTTQVLQEQTQSAYLTSYHTSLAQIDNILADPAAGVSPAMQDFFNALNGVANAPESVPARQTLLSNAQFAVNRFNGIDQRLTDISNGLTGQISSSVNLVNSYALQISTLNGNIKRAVSAGQGQLPNDLLDQRDQLVNQLNQQIKTTAQAQPDGTVNVFIGNGQALVVGEQSMALKVLQSATDPSKVDVAYLSNGQTITMQQSSLQGGNLGAYLTFRDQSLEPARNALGRVALGLAASINQQNQLGQDLNGAMGAALLSAAAPRVDKGANNAGTATLSASITNVSALTTSDYQLRFDGTNYSMLRLTDNAVTNLGTSLAAPVNVDGFSVSLTGAMQAGDTFLVRPTANAARDIALLTNDPAKIAAALPMRTMAGAANAGTGVISSGTINTNPVNIVFSNPAVVPQTYTATDTATGTALGTGNFTAGSPISFNGWTVSVAGTPALGDTFSLVKNTSANSMITSAAATNAGTGAITGGALSLQQPFSVTFNAVVPPATLPTYTVTGAVPAVALPVSYTPGTTISLSYNGWTAQITGTPSANDTFNLAANINGKGDNRNALAMASMQTQNLLANGTASLQGGYGQLVGEVGAKTSELAVTSLAQSNMVSQTVKAQQSVSGVNLDEEAANLLRFQRAYQAAAKAMQISNAMFDSLLTLGK